MHIMLMLNCWNYFSEFFTCACFNSLLFAIANEELRAMFVDRMHNNINIIIQIRSQKMNIEVKSLLQNRCSWSSHQMKLVFSMKKKHQNSKHSKKRFKHTRLEKFPRKCFYIGIYANVALVLSRAYYTFRMSK